MSGLTNIGLATLCWLLVPFLCVMSGCGEAKLNQQLYEESKSRQQILEADLKLRQELAEEALEQIRSSNEEFERLNNDIRRSTRQRQLMSPFR